MKIAIIHDWLTVYSGAERVLEELLDIFPDADIYTLIDTLSERERAFLRGRKINASMLQKVPLSKQFYRHFFPFFPILIESFDLTSYDLVISSSSCVAKGVLISPDQLHVCMCYSPVRYAHDLKFQYLNQSYPRSAVKRFLASIFLHKLRIWDVVSSNSVDHFISISNYISKRINKAYRRNSDVIYPPVFVEDFRFQENKSDYYIVACRLVPYKMVPMIIDAFRQMPNKKLLVVGDGPDYNKCKLLINDNITMLGHISHSELVNLLANAKAYVYAAIEDFGIAPIEAQASGTPVIAYSGGALPETIIVDGDNPTGVLYYEQTVSALVAAVERFESMRISPNDCYNNSLRFGRSIFRANIRDFFSKIGINVDEGCIHD